MIRKIVYLFVLMMLSVVAAADAQEWILSDDVLEKIGAWTAVFTSSVGTFALIAAITPTQRDDRIVGRLMKIVDFLGANFGAAKNKNAEKNKG